MTALARDRDGEHVGRGHQRTIAVADLAGIDARPEIARVKSDKGIDFGILHHAVLDHRERSRGRLLRGLEDQFDRSLQRVAVGHQNFGRPQQHRGVRVVPAGVHPPVHCGGVRQPRLLPNGQGVYVRTHSQHLAGQSAPDHRGNPVFGNAGADLRRAHLLEPLLDEGRCLRGLEPQLRVRVQAPAPLHELRVHLQSLFLDVHHLETLPVQTSPVEFRDTRLFYSIRFRFFG